MVGKPRTTQRNWKNNVGGKIVGESRGHQVASPEPDPASRELLERRATSGKLGGRLKILYVAPRRAWIWIVMFESYIIVFIIVYL